MATRGSKMGSKQKQNKKSAESPPLESVVGFLIINGRSGPVVELFVLVEANKSYERECCCTEHHQGCDVVKGTRQYRRSLQQHSVLCYIA